MTKNILVTGCGGDIGQSIGKILKSTRLFKHVIGADISNDNAAQFIFDEVVQVPRCSSEEYLPAVNEIFSRCGIDLWLPIAEPELRVLTDNGVEDLLLDKPLICANLNARSVGFDKYKTATFLQQADLPFPVTAILGEVTKPELPLILKSRNGSGSKSLFIVENVSDFKFYQSKYPQFIAQELIGNNAEEYTCGLFRTRAGEVRSIIYRRTLLGGFSGFGEVVENHAVTALLNSIAMNLNLVGSINVQLRLSDKGPCVFEINPRFSSTVMFRHMMGFTDVLWSIQDRLGIPLNSYAPAKPGSKFYKGFTEYVS